MIIRAYCSKQTQSYPSVKEGRNIPKEQILIYISCIGKYFIGYTSHCNVIVDSSLQRNYADYKYWKKYLIQRALYWFVKHVRNRVLPICLHFSFHHLFCVYKYPRSRIHWCYQCSSASYKQTRAGAVNIN